MVHSHLLASRYERRILFMVLCLVVAPALKERVFQRVAGVHAVRIWSAQREPVANGGFIILPNGLHTEPQSYSRLITQVIAFRIHARLGQQVSHPNVMCGQAKLLRPAPVAIEGALKAAQRLYGEGSAVSHWESPDPDSAQ